MTVWAGNHSVPSFFSGSIDFFGFLGLPHFASNFLRHSGGFSGSHQAAAFQILTVVPLFAMLIGLTALMCLVCARQIFPASPASAIYGTALSTWILLVASSTGNVGGEAAASFYARLLNIAIAVIYIVVASSLLRTRALRSAPV